MDKDVEHLLDERTVGDIDSELAHVNRQLDAVKEKRDRRMLLAGLLRRADAEFRRKHQPNVIRRASAYLEAITQGRYERIDLTALRTDGAVTLDDRFEDSDLEVDPTR